MGHKSKRKTWIYWLSVLYCARFKGNSRKYGVKFTAEDPGSPLRGKTIIFLGSSVTTGDSALGDGVIEFLKKVDGVVPVKDAVSGSTLADTGVESYVPRMVKNIPTDVHADAFVCQLSTNDATKELPIGEIADGRSLESFDISTTSGAMEYIICYAKQTWNCPVFFYTGTRYESAHYASLVRRIYELKKKWDFTIIDLWSDDAFNNIDESTRKLYMLPDGVHPLRAGYRYWWLPEFERVLKDTLV